MNITLPTLTGKPVTMTSQSPVPPRRSYKYAGVDATHFPII